MQQTSDGPVLSPTDLTQHLACARPTTLDPARHEIAVPEIEDEALAPLVALGRGRPRPHRVGPRGPAASSGRSRS